MEKLIDSFKNAIQSQDLTFDMCCYVYDTHSEDRYIITEVVELDTQIQICFADFSGEDTTMTIDDLWTKFCSIDTTKPVVFYHRDSRTFGNYIDVDDCLGTTIDFNISTDNKK